VTDRPDRRDGGPAWRTVTVPAERLPRWVAGFARNHGDALAGSLDPGTGSVRITAPDGARAVLRPPAAPDGAPLPPAGARPAAAADPPGGGLLAGDGLSAAVATLAGSVVADRTLGVVLVRRGGFAAAVVERGELAAHRVGTRHVQGRTAAGGWSQQRFSRRRDKQADELAAAAVRLAAGVLRPWAGRLDGLATGGDRPLVDRVLADRCLAFLADLPRRRHLAVGDPRGNVVRALPALLSGVRVEVCP